MDFRQSKLSKNEWISIEKPVDIKEKNVLDMIVKGYFTPNYKIHLYHVISEVVKLEHSEKDYYIYVHILKEPIDKLIKTFKLSTIETSVPKKKLNGADTIRIQSYRKKQLDNIEYMILSMVEKFFDKKREYYFYNICVLYKKYTINKYLAKWIEAFIKKYNDTMSVITFLENGLLDAFGKGIYKQIDTYIVQANFGGRIHLLLFNNDYTEFTSIRKDDGEIIKGKLM